MLLEASGDSGVGDLCWMFWFFQFPALREFVKLGKPVWGTCAGLIFLANKAIGLFLSSPFFPCVEF